MLSTRGRIFTGVAAVTVATSLMGGGVAAARDMKSYSKDGGAYAYSVGTNGAVAIHDNKGDDRWVYAMYHRAGYAGDLSIANHNGTGTTLVSATDLKHVVLGLRACTNYDLSPDDCDVWR